MWRKISKIVTGFCLDIWYDGYLWYYLLHKAVDTRFILWKSVRISPN